ncbi:MAG: 30S ribosomal protein S16 [Candidatus Omnitrophota bacterium]
MVAIRLRKVSKTKKRFHFRIIVSDSKSALSSRCIEELGYYNPAKNPPYLKINNERMTYWIKRGARVSATIKRLYKRAVSQKG